MSRPVKIPGPDHPITVTPARGRVTVIAAGRTIADTRDALILKEAAYPPVYYIPRKDVDMARLQRTTHQSYCPYKGECNYYSIPLGWIPASGESYSSCGPRSGTGGRRQ